MTIASKLETINEALGDIKSSIVAKGVTPTGDITTYSTAIDSISTGDEITATNTTGSAVSADDRVWVSGEDVYTQNFTIAGSPTIDSTTKVMSNLSYDNYIYFLNPNYRGYSTLEINSKFRYSASVGEFRIFEGDTSTFKITILGNENKISVYLATNIGAWAIIGKGSTTLVEDTVYYVKLRYDGSAFQLLLSTDGTTWNTDYNNITDIVLRYGGGNGVIGQANVSNSSEIYLLETNIKKDGNIIWTPYTKTGTNYSIINDTDITSTSFTGIAQEAIANNATGSVKTLLDGNGTYAPTTATKTITTNGTYTASAENAYGLSEVTVNVPTPDTWYNWKNSVFSRDFTLSNNNPPSINDTNKIMTINSSGVSYIYKGVGEFTVPESIEAQINIKINSLSSTNDTLFRVFSDDNSFGYGNGISINYLSSGVFSVALNGSAKGISNTNVSTGVEYFVKILIEASQTTLFVSTDGINFESVSTDLINTSNLYGQYITLGKMANTLCEYDLLECYVKVDGNTVWTPYTETTSEAYTLTASPTTSTQVYEIPKKTSALTITAVGTGTITLSDSKVYNRNSAGDVKSPVLGTKTITSNDTYTAASDYLDGFSSVTVDVPSAPTKKYNLLDRVKDDSNNEIGTVSGFFTDANNVEYAVVCLDAQYRLEKGTYCSDTIHVITGLPVYDITTWGPWEAKETATFNTQKIIDYCSSSGATSGACSHCRSKSFTIDGTTYYGQLPNMIELNDIIRNHTALDTADPTASSYSSVNFISDISIGWWSSSQSVGPAAWCGYAGSFFADDKDMKFGAAPVLEIPNT